MQSRVAQETAISVNNLRAIQSLSDVEFEDIFVFQFCSSPDPAIVINLSADFRKLYYKTFLMNLHNFPYFDTTKKSANKNIISFSGIPY